jgi:hypothetical protein
MRSASARSRAEMPSGLQAALAAFVASICGALAVFLALHHPLAPWTATGVLVVWIGACIRYPSAWLLVLPALLPLTGFASWSGWLTVEEWDILTLGAAAAGYLRWAAPRAMPARASAADEAPRARAADDAGSRRTTRRTASRAVMVLFALYGVSGLIALVRGIADAGGPTLGWWQDYYGPLNSLRVFKGYLAAALLSPLLGAAIARDRVSAMSWLGYGVAVAGAGAALAVVWERAAFTGLLDFSTDYRATGPFWEMHVGGAALDGFLAMTFPFTVWAMLRTRDRLAMMLAASMVLMSLYACLVTFSRGVWLAIPVSCAVLAWGLSRRSATAARLVSTLVSLKGVAWLCLTGVLCYLIFRSGGYRALAAAFATLVVAGAVANIRSGATTAQWGVALLMGTLAAVALAAVSPHVPKGPYVMFATAMAVACPLAWGAVRATSSHRVVAALAALVCTAGMAALVAYGWGGERALASAALAVGVILLFALVATRPGRVRLLPDRRTQVFAVGAAAGVAAVVAVLSGGSYMAERFATGASGLEARITHWRDGLRMLEGPGDWILGRGLGRYPATYFFNAPNNGVPGSSALERDGARRFLALSGPQYPTSFGDLFRIGQRIRPHREPYAARLTVRADAEATLHVEICMKHLLYAAECSIATAKVPATAAAWHTVSTVLDGRRLSPGPWYAPRLAFFSVAVETSSRVVDIDEVVLLDGAGRDVIVNGGFEDGMANWFFTSDTYHLPWHIENVWLGVLFDQGIVGAALFTLLVAAAFWSVTGGAAAADPIGPYLASVIAGFLVVGAFATLIDVPRVAFLWFLLIVVVGKLSREPFSGTSRPASAIA